MSTICYLHGLNSSHYSFAYLAQQLDHPQVPKINYLSHQPLIDSVRQVSKQLPKNEPLTLIGHSLGGVIAMLLAHDGNFNIEKVVTISSPLGGSKAAVFARWIVSGVRVLNDITPNSAYIKLINSEPAPCPILSVISTGGGISTSNEPNDSIVTVASQRSLPYGKKVEIKANHFEVLLVDKTADAVKTFLKA